MAIGNQKIYTIDDIAKELGVSTTTVSRSISGKGRISAATRARVLEFISQHNYRPNAQARGLAQNKTYNLGLVLPLDFSEASPAFFKDCMSGICEMAAENNYDVMISMTDGNDLTQIGRLADNRKVDGMIVSRPTADRRVENFLKEEGMPFVVIGPGDDPEIFFADNDNRGACRELTGFLLGKGLRRLALAGGSTRHRVTESRRAGYLEAHREHGVPVCEPLLFLEVDSPVKAARTLDLILEAGADGILCMDDSICGLMLGALKERGVQVPQKIRLASFYDSRQLEYNVPPVTSLRFATKELGKQACRLLLDVMEGKEAKSRILAGYQVILRESTK